MRSRGHLQEEGAYDWEAYAAHLAGEADALVDAAIAATRTRVALLCCEVNPADCHRSLIADHIRVDASVGVQHL